MARGSRYKNRGQLVGPQNMEQLSWIDIAKAHLHIGGVVPVPTVSIQSAFAGITTLFDEVGSSTEHPEGGDVMRFIANTSTNAELGFITSNPGVDVSVVSSNATTITVSTNTGSIFSPGDTIVVYQSDLSTIRLKAIVTSVTGDVLTVTTILGTAGSAVLNDRILRRLPQSDVFNRIFVKMDTEIITVIPPNAVGWQVVNVGGTGATLTIVNPLHVEFTKDD